MTTPAASIPLAKAILDEKFTQPLWLVTLAVLGTIVITISAKINVPMWPVPMTMQTFAILVIAMAYGARLGGATVALYLAEGAAGLPVFAGGGGLAYMAGPTGGYLAGFLMSAIVVGLLAERGWSRNWLLTLLAMTLGTAIIFVPGVAWLATLIGTREAIAGGLTPFIWGSVFKIALGAAVMPFAWSLVGVRAGR
jgi:biotin transport system substrate-specific component